MSWARYIKKNGPLNTGSRIDQAAALICSVAARLAGNKTAKPEDFMPQLITEGEEEPESTTPVTDLFRKKGTKFSGK